MVPCGGSGPSGPSQGWGCDAFVKALGIVPIAETTQPEDADIPPDSVRTGDLSAMFEILGREANLPVKIADCAALSLVTQHLWENA
jgi:hypothetical protein